MSVPVMLAVAMTLLNLGAGIAYAWIGDWRHAAYWFACAVISMSVTSLK